MQFPWGWVGLAGLVVLAVGIWLRRRQAVFVAELRARGDALADHKGTKTFRREFQAWLLRGVGAGQARGVLTLLLALALLALAGYSLMPGLWEEGGAAR